MRYAVIVVKGWPMLVAEAELPDYAGCTIIATSQEPLELIGHLDRALSKTGVDARAQPGTAQERRERSDTRDKEQ